MIYRALRPLLFLLDAELSHDLTIASLAVAGSAGLLDRVLPQPVADPVHLFGVDFQNRVGLAAGLDKNGRCIRGMQALGFGFIEVGTATPQAQPGNPRPRLFRLPEYNAIINRMGFNNDGVEALVERVRQARRRGAMVPIGINIGKNRLTDPGDAVNDYLICLRTVVDYADYVTINLSSPNTPGLRDLQFGDALDQLLRKMSDCRNQLADQKGNMTPLLVKIAPDMAKEDLLRVADKLLHYKFDGIIATNTTIDRSAIESSPLANESGGLSGAILFDKSTEVIKTLAQHVGGALAIIGVGGIQSAEDAVVKIKAGADLVQVYTGLIYRGPALIPESADAIRDAAGSWNNHY